MCGTAYRTLYIQYICHKITQLRLAISGDLNGVEQALQALLALQSLVTYAMQGLLVAGYGQRRPGVGLQ